MTSRITCHKQPLCYSRPDSIKDEGVRLSKGEMGSRTILVSGPLNSHLPYSVCLKYGIFSFPDIFLQE